MLPIYNDACARGVFHNDAKSAAHTPAPLECPPSLRPSLLLCISMERSSSFSRSMLSHFFELTFVAPTDSLIFRRLLFPFPISPSPHSTLTLTLSTPTPKNSHTFVHRARDDARCTTNSATVHSRLCSGRRAQVNYITYVRARDSDRKQRRQLPV